MNKPLKSDTPKAEMKINVQGYKVTLCFAERPNPIENIARFLLEQ